MSSTIPNTTPSTRYQAPVTTSINVQYSAMFTYAKAKNPHHHSRYPQSTLNNTWTENRKFSTNVDAGRAYDTAVFNLRGPSIRLNIPDSIGDDGHLQDLSSNSIRKKATEAGGMVEDVCVGGGEDI
ncbi:unnamed protein product [Lactuca saligna]|uniref:AP2/ERF domain-containing protein n=1 Tax=Lactuca saligna TaxID=75948 RepID=A0AA35V3A1_LACSI|nr:unnamed protein product [Lactuca saligna]